MSQMLELEVVSNDGTAVTVSVRRLGRALSPDSLASLLASWLRTHGSRDPLTLGRMVGRELHSAPARHGLVVRLLAGVLASLAEYDLELQDGEHRAAIQLAQRLTETIEGGELPLPSPPPGSRARPESP